jgi:homoprotocatechuate degradation regulator HpaR
MSIARRRRPIPDLAQAGFTHRNLPLLLLHARESVIARFRPILNAQGVTEQQWRVVRALLERGPLEQRQVGEVCRISSPSLAGVLARMDDLGLVKRERLEADQRRVRVDLTAKSRALAARLAPRIEAEYRDIEAHIGSDFITRFYATLDELIGLMGEMPPVADD